MRLSSPMLDEVHPSDLPLLLQVKPIATNPWVCKMLGRMEPEQQHTARRRPRILLIYATVTGTAKAYAMKVHSSATVQTNLFNLQKATHHVADSRTVRISARRLLCPEDTLGKAHTLVSISAATATASA